MADDYYKVLNVSKSASADEIQKSYRRLARKYHPDLHVDKDEREKEAAKQQFQKIQQAYDVLSDPKKRQMYDQMGPDFQNMGGGNPFGGGAGPQVDFSQIFGAGGPGGGGGGFEDLLRQFGMGGASRGGGGPRRGPTPPARGADIEQKITIPFATSIMGGQHQLSLQRNPGKVDKINITIPPGIESEKKIRLRGQGHVGFDGAPRGDLLVLVKVAPHPTFTRSGLNLSVTLPITISEAAKGAKIDLPTPHGTITVTVPPGSSSGKALRLKGMGVKTRDRKGDLIATLQIVLPEELTQAEIEMLEKVDAKWNGKGPRDELLW